MKQLVVRTKNSLEELQLLFNERKFQNLLFVTGNHFDGTRLNIFRKVGVGLRHWVPPGGAPQLAEMKLAAAEMHFRPDVIVAIGGGRILDAAKLMVHQLGDRPYFVAIPTTAGSGSEATPFAVAYEGRKKISVQAEGLLPHHVMLDPGFLSFLPPSQRAVSAMDALAQSVESIWSLHATEISVAYARTALEALWQHMESFTFQQPFVYDAVMLDAAYAAGKAIAVTRTTGCHALSYYLTAVHDVPHGQAVGFFLPAFFIYNDEAQVQTKLEVIYEVTGAKDATDACRLVQQRMRSCGLAVRFSDMGLSVDLEALLDSVNEERFANNPVPFNREALKQLIRTYIW